MKRFCESQGCSVTVKQVLGQKTALSCNSHDPLAKPTEGTEADTNEPVKYCHFQPFLASLNCGGFCQIGNKKDDEHLQIDGNPKRHNIIYAAE